MSVVEMKVPTIGESINEVLGLLVGRAKKPAGLYINEESEKYLYLRGENFSGQVGGFFDLLQVALSAHKRVVSVLDGNRVLSQCGVAVSLSATMTNTGSWI